MLKTTSYGVIVVLALSAIVGTGIVLADEISICIAPATLNLNAGVQECDDVIVHADILYNDVNESCDTLILEIRDDSGNVATTTDLTKCCPDSCGNLVAGFNQTEVVKYVAAGKVYDLALTGKDNDGNDFITATDTLRVINEGK